MLRKHRAPSSKRNNIKGTCFIGVIAALMIIINVLAFKGQSNTWENRLSGTRYAEREEILLTEAFSSDADRLVQYFRPTEIYLRRLYVRFALADKNADISGLELHIALYDDCGTLVKETEIDSGSFKNKGYYKFNIGKEVDKSKIYQVEVKQTAGFDEDEDVSAVCFISPENLKESKGAEFNGQPIDGNLEILYYYRCHTLNPYIKLLAGSIVLLLVAIVLKNLLRRKKENARGTQILSWFLWFATPALMFVILETIAGNIATIEQNYLLKNLLIFYAIYLIFCAVFTYQSAAAIIYCSVMTVLALAEYYVLSFRGRPFMIFDIWSAGTAVKVARNYTYEIPVRMGWWLLGVLLMLIFQYYLQKLRIPKKKWIVAVHVSYIGVFAVGIVLILKTDIMRQNGAEPIELWNLNSNYQNMGSLYTLYLEFQYVYVQKPENYSLERVKSIAEYVGKQENDTNVIQPENLIVVMNESLSDFERLGTVNTDTELLPYLDSMEENTEKGWLQMPVRGGGTCDSEYEVLTGNTKQFLPVGTMAYEFYCGNPEYGMTTSLKEQGYRTIALHPANPKSWNRTQVYEEMGFDDFISIDNWESEIEFLREQPSDKTAYDKLIEIIENKESGEKLFTFLVTIQNHGGYTDEYLGDYTPTVALHYDTEYPQAETFLSIANESDKAFEQLIKHFEDEEQPTMIVMFGDHFPGFSDGFYDTLLQWDEIDMEINQRIYQTPYVIWTNYEQEASSDNIMSANYFGSHILQLAGVNLTLYNKFLLNLKESLPVIGMGAVRDKEGEWYSLEDLPEEYSEMLNDYRILQYNNVIDRKNRYENVFTVDNMK